MDLPSLGLDLVGSHVVVTGGAGLIGSVVVAHFLAAGSLVSSLDIAHSTAANTEANPRAIHCDISDESSVQAAFEAAAAAHGPVEVCIALASLDMSVLQASSFVDASFVQLKRVLDVNIAGTWLTARAWLRGIRIAKQQGKKLKNVNLIIIGSESGHFGERQNVEYSLAKSAVQHGLLLSLKGEVVREWPGARVNAVAPGPVDTARWKEECKQNPDQYYLAAQATTALCEPVPQAAVAKAILFLASENFSSHVHGQTINVDGGKLGKVIWTKEEVA